MFKIGDKVYDWTEDMNHDVVHVITDKYYDEGCDIAMLELDNDYTVSAECVALADED